MDIECRGLERQDNYLLYSIYSNDKKYSMDIMYPEEISHVKVLMRCICPYIEDSFKDKIPLLQIIEMANLSEIGIVGCAYPDINSNLIMIGMSKHFINNIKQSNSKKEFSESMIVLIKMIVHEFWHLNGHKSISELTSEEIKEIFEDYQEQITKEGGNNG